MWASAPTERQIRIFRLFRNVRMVVDMVLAVAAIPCALRAVAELQIRVRQLRAAADRAAEAGLALLVGDLVDPPLLHLPLPALPGGMIADEIRQDVGRLLSEEDQPDHDGHQGQKPVQIDQAPGEAGNHGDDPGDRGKEGQPQIDPGQPLHLHGEDEPDPDLLIRQQRGHSQEEAEVDVEGAGSGAQEQSGQIRQQDADQIIEVEAQHTPGLLQHAAAPVIEKQPEGAPDGPGFHHVDQGIAEEPPDLAVEDGVAVEDQQTVEQRVVRLQDVEQVDQDVANGEKEHQIADALVLIVIEKAVDLASKLCHWITSQKAGSGRARNGPDLYQYTPNPSDLQERNCKQCTGKRNIRKTYGARKKLWKDFFGKRLIILNLSCILINGTRGTASLMNNPQKLKYSQPGGTVMKY